MQWERSGGAISCSHEPIMEKEHGEQCDGEGFVWKREGKRLIARRCRFGEAKRK